MIAENNSSNHIHHHESAGEQQPAHIIIPVIEERVTIDKAIVERGRLRVAKEIITEQETVNIPLLHDEFTVEHKAVNRFVDEVPAMRKEGNVTIIPVLKEVVVKRVMLVEEIYITQHQVETVAEQEISIRKEQISITRTPSANH